MIKDEAISEIPPEDYAGLSRLLAKHSLLSGDLAAGSGTYFAFNDDDGWCLGVGGVEIYGEFALMRSFLTLESARGKGYGRRLAAHIFHEAHQQGAREIFLFTEDASGFFEKLGFRLIPREHMPPAIQSSDQFRLHCGDGAKAMARTLP